MSIYMTTNWARAMQFERSSIIVAGKCIQG